MSSSTSSDPTKVPPSLSKVKLPLPSLDQLAARLSPTASPLSGTGNFGGNGTNAAATRSTRLPATLLARASPITLGQSSNSSEISLADSTKANPPSADDRSISPTPSSNTTSTNTDAQDDTMDDTNVSVPGPGLTAEHLEQHNKATAISPSSALSEDAFSPLSRLSATSSKPIRGYKNVPTLDDITKRLHKTRLLSVDGTDAPPPGVPRTQPSQQNQQNRVSVGEAPHPLQHPWILYHDNKARQAPHDPSIPYVPSNTETDAYEANLTLIGEFDTVEDFCRYFNWLKPPSQLERNSNYHLFKSGIKPMWEDPANSNGGKWVLTMKSNPQLLDRCWSWLVFALVGEELDDAQGQGNDTDEICGAVVSLRSKVDRIQVWTRSKDVERVNRIGKRLIKLLDVSEKDGIGLDFQFHQDERPTPSKYLSIQATFPASSFRNSFTGTPFAGGINPYSGLPPNAYGGIPGGAFGAFNQPIQVNPNIGGNGVVSGGVPLGFPQGAMGTFGMGAANTAFGSSNTGGSWRQSGGSGFRR
ncbi:hypothetical protein Clacol_004794 [Clathrus columnatus]|uniref:Translation initiation factor eIF4e n=1 Tax=Clathrus columnatus TaxID=1419009 RepID=A0AAV5AA40_9AGAM|nr:hypothetical protein Clacol_004794 [Clathrus columnatus]